MNELVEREFEFVENQKKTLGKVSAYEKYKQTFAYKLGEAITKFVNEYQLQNKGHNNYWQSRLDKSKTMETKIDIITFLEPKIYEEKLETIFPEVEKAHQAELKRLEAESLERIANLEKELDDE